MIEWLQYLLSNENTKLIYILTLLSFLMLVDSVVGTIVAKLNPNTQFSSFKLKTGFLIKLVQLLLCIIAVPFAVMFDMGLVFLYVAYIAMCGAEFYSILGHMKVVDDDNKGLHILETLWKQLFNKENDNNGTK